MSRSSKEKSLEPKRSGSQQSDSRNLSPEKEEIDQTADDGDEIETRKVISKSASRRFRRNRLIRGLVVKNKHLIHKEIAKPSSALQEVLKAEAVSLSTTSKCSPPGPLLNESTPTDYKMAIYDQREDGIKYIERKDAKLLLAMLHVLLAEELKKGATWLPKFYYTDVQDGYFFVNCADEKSMTWLKDIVPLHMQNLWTGACLKVVKMSKISERRFVVVGVFHDDQMATHEVVQYLSLQNPWFDIPGWILQQRTRVPVGPGKTNFYFSISKEDKIEMFKRKNKLFYKIDRINVNFVNFVQRRSRRTEEVNGKHSAESQQEENPEEDTWKEEEAAETEEDKNNQSADMQDISDDDDFFMEDDNWEVIDQE